MFLGGRCGSPFQCPKEGRENSGVIITITRNFFPWILIKSSRADFRIPQDADLLALRVVVDTGKRSNREGIVGFCNVFHEPTARTQFNDFSWFPGQRLLPSKPLRICC
jgi:hypothetical protein